MHKDTKLISDFASKSDKAEIIEFLANYIISLRDDLTIDIKWKKLTFALNNDFHHWICSITPTKTDVVLYFHFGGLLEDKNNVLEKGSSKFLRMIRFKEIEAIDKEAIKNLIEKAINKLQFFKDNWKSLNKDESF